MRKSVVGEKRGWEPLESCVVAWDKERHRLVVGSLVS